MGYLTAWLTFICTSEYWLLVLCSNNTTACPERAYDTWFCESINDFSRTKHFIILHFLEIFFSTWENVSYLGKGYLKKNSENGFSYVTYDICTVPFLWLQWSLQSVLSCNWCQGHMASLRILNWLVNILYWSCSNLQ